MKVVVFGATGLVGHGVLQECLRDPDVTEVVAVGRVPTGVSGVRDVVHGDFLDFGPITPELAGADACFWCLGVSSVGMSPQAYERITYDYTMAAARALAAITPDLGFVYVSGAGTDSTEAGRVRWARVKGRVENEVMALFPRGYAFRPAVVEPVHGVRSKTALYRWGWRVMAPLVPALRRMFPSSFVTTAEIGRAMLLVARRGYPRRVLENRDIVAAGRDPRE